MVGSGSFLSMTRFRLKLIFVDSSSVITQCRARLCPMTIFFLSFGIPYWNALQIVHKFCRLIGIQKSRLSSSENPTKFIWNDNKSTCRIHKQMVLIGHWRNSEPHAVASAFPMSLINTVWYCTAHWVHCLKIQNLIRTHCAYFISSSSFLVVVLRLSVSRSSLNQNATWWCVVCEPMLACHSETSHWLWIH